MLRLKPGSAAHTDGRLAAEVIDRRVTRLQTLATVVEGAAGHQIAQLEARPARTRAERGSGQTEAGRRLVVVLQAGCVGTRADMRPDRKFAVEFRQRLGRRNLKVDTIYCRQMSHQII